jgi:hypothetical protein
LCPHGYIFYPYAKNDKKAMFLERVIKNDAEEKYSVVESGLAIPKSDGNFETFRSQITSNEVEFCKLVNNGSCSRNSFLPMEKIVKAANA